MSLDIWLCVRVDTGVGFAEEIPINGTDLNITHNVVPMWRKAGVYDALYKSDGDEAGKHLSVLRSGLASMQDAREEYEKLNPANGWGSYGSALDFLGKWIAICARRPKATISVSA